MRPKLSLFTKVLCLGFLNLTLLALVFVLFARIQFRLDAGSFLLAPAQNRILAMAHTLALELDEKPTAEWSQTLERFSQANRVVLYLLNEEGEHVAGPQLQAPDPVMARIPRRQRQPRGDRPPDRPRPRREEVPKREAARRGPAPPLFLTATSDPTRYWAGVQIPVRQDRQENPKPGSLILMSTSLISSPLFFRSETMAGSDAGCCAGIPGLLAAIYPGSHPIYLANEASSRADCRGPIRGARRGWAAG